MAHSIRVHRLSVAPHRTHGDQRTVPRHTCWRVEGSLRVIGSAAVAGEHCEAGAYSMPNKGLQATASSLRSYVAPASGGA